MNQSDKRGQFENMCKATDMLCALNSMPLDDAKDFVAFRQANNNGHEANKIYALVIELVEHIQMRFDRFAQENPSLVFGTPPATDPAVSGTEK